VNKIMRIMKWFREMSILAEDEQRRSDHPEIDVEHLFLALVSIGGPVTDFLAEHGVTLTAARAAFERIHARRLSGIGVSVPEGAARRIPAGNTRGGFVYREGVRKLLEDAANEPAQDVALFRALLDQPSGDAREVLRDLGVDPDALGQTATTEVDSATRSHRAAEYQRFVGEKPAAVWALVSDPDRWLEWNEFEFDSAETTDDGIIRAYARERRQDGKPMKLKPEFAVSEFVVSRFEPPRLIQWERSFPSANRQGTQSLRLSLAPQKSGTDLTVSFVHIGPLRGRRTPMGWLLRPLAKLLHPFMVRAHLRGKADNISRALRQQPA
jgi:ATP-dependent Clp protease ATP-binding subunit ClpA